MKLLVVSEFDTAQCLGGDILHFRTGKEIIQEKLSFEEIGMLFSFIFRH